MCSVDATYPEDRPALDGAARLLARPIMESERIAGGRNSRVYRVRTDDAIEYAVKIYYSRGAVGRDQLSAEYAGLEFIHKNLANRTPRPIAADKTLGVAVYEFISGEPIRAEAATPEDIDEAASFIEELYLMKDKPGASALPVAAEAFFSARDIISNIETRLERLLRLPAESPTTIAMRDFLTKEFAPSFKKTADWCHSELTRCGITVESVLEEKFRTLSPSDFGFHNAIRSRDGGIYFIDFEYFGWDDPAKLISDFLLHPGMALDFGLRKRFAGRAFEIFSKDGLIEKRTKILYPLFGLKWCMILLNEFLPEDLGRRSFAAGGEVDKEQLKAGQLSKAAEMLAKTNESCVKFPYHDV